MKPPPLQGDDAEDFALLSMANGKGKFGLQLGEVFPPIQAAFERGIDEDWFRFVDVSRIGEPIARGLLMRIFKLTDKGRDRLVILTGKQDGG